MYILEMNFFNAMKLDLRKHLKHNSFTQCLMQKSNRTRWCDPQNTPQSCMGARVIPKLQKGIVHTCLTTHILLRAYLHA